MSGGSFDYSLLGGRQVEVVADGILYKGRLIEMGEEDIYLESSSGWTTIRVDRVSEVRQADS